MIELRVARKAGGTKKKAHKPMKENISQVRVIFCFLFKNKNFGKSNVRC